MKDGAVHNGAPINGHNKAPSDTLKLIVTTLHNIDIKLKDASQWTE